MVKEIMIKVELLIPTKQYSNIKFEITAKDEQDLDTQINHLWGKYYNYFDKKDDTRELLNKLNSDRSNKIEKHKLDYTYDLPEE